MKYFLKSTIIAISSINIFTICNVCTASTHLINQPVSDRFFIPTNKQVDINISVKITDKDLIQSSVNLIRIDDNGSTIVGKMQFYGDDTYKVNLLLNEKSINKLRFQVSASFKGALKRVLSGELPVYAINTPDGFTLNDTVFESKGPLSFNNFNSEYVQGGIIPANGAEIDLNRILSPPPPLDNYISEIEVQDSIISSITTENINNVTCTKVTYTDNYTPYLSYKNVNFYCPTNLYLYKFYLTYLAGDQQSNNYENKLHEIINKINF